MDTALYKNSYIMDFRKEIPQQLHNNVLFVSFLNLKETRIIICLTKNLKFYEFRNRQLIAEIGLTSFLDLNSFQIKTLDEIAKNSEILKQNVISRTQSVRFSESNSEKLINIAKYIKYFGHSKKIYIILKIFDKILILERGPKYKIIQKLNNVENFEITDINSSYQANIVVYFKWSNKKEIIKIEDQNWGKKNDDLHFDKTKDLFDVVKKVRNEYEAQKRTTKKRFMTLKNLSTFGCNLIRSLNVDEKQILTRCGDIWLKTYNDSLVIGIPITNNCTENLTTLVNVRPIVVGKNSDQLLFNFNLYELKLNNSNIDYNEINQFILDDIESDKIVFDESWYPLRNRNLKPGSAAVILLKSSLQNFSPYSILDYIIFINFDLMINQNLFTQNLFIKLFELNIVDLIQKCNIIKEVQKEGNFLTILETSKRYSFLLQNTIKEESESLFEMIINFVKNEMKFEEINCKIISEKIDQMEIDDGYIEINKEGFIKTYANLNSSFWSGTILKFQVDEIMAKNIYFRIFTKSDNHALIVIQQFCKNFLFLNNFSFYQKNKPDMEDKINFIEDKLKDEISILIHSLKYTKNQNLLNKSELLNLQYQKYSKELEIDLSFLHFS